MRGVVSGRQGVVCGEWFAPLVGGPPCIGVNHMLLTTQLPF